MARTNLIGARWLRREKCSVAAVGMSNSFLIFKDTRDTVVISDERRKKNERNALICPTANRIKTKVWKSIRCSFCWCHHYLLSRLLRSVLSRYLFCFFRRDYACSSLVLFGAMDRCISFALQIVDSNWSEIRKNMTEKTATATSKKYVTSFFMTSGEEKHE